MTDWYSDFKTDLARIIILATIIVIVGNIFNAGVDSSDTDGWNRSGMKIHTDKLTGCQYLSGGIKRKDFHE